MKIDNNKYITNVFNYLCYELNILKNENYLNPFINNGNIFLKPIKYINTFKNIHPNLKNDGRI